MREYVRREGDEDWQPGSVCTDYTSGAAAEPAWVWRGGEPKEAELRSSDP